MKHDRNLVLKLAHEGCGWPESYLWLRRCNQKDRFFSFMHLRTFVLDQLGAKVENNTLEISYEENGSTVTESYKECD